MKKKFIIPFSRLNSVGVQNILIVASVSFLIITSVYTVIKFDICQDYGGDFCAFWSAGKLINQSGYGAIYDLDKLIDAQFTVFQENDLSAFRYRTILYLPIFLLPFQFLALFKISTAYLLWLFINLIGFIVYLFFFIKHFGGSSVTKRIILLVMISLPVFYNIQEGQANIWLAICTGEFIKALLDDKPFRAGLWLGGWILKPQLLVLVFVFLLIQRLMKTLLGVITSSGFALIISFLLVGVRGFVNLKDILLMSSEGGGLSYPQIMMNWRMLGLNLASFTSQTIGQIIIVAGSLLTIGLTFFILRKKIPKNSPWMVIALLGLFAATCAVTWHSHYHMSIVLVPPLIYLLLNGQLKMKSFSVWVFVPILIEFLIFLVLGLSGLGLLPTPISPYVLFGEGLRGFAINIWLWIWALVAIDKSNNALPDPVSHASSG